MPAELIDGVAIAKKVRARVADEAAALKAKGLTPGLTVVLVGDDPASAVYVGSKEKACKEAGMNGETIRLPASTTAPGKRAFHTLLKRSSRSPGVW